MKGRSEFEKLLDEKLTASQSHNSTHNSSLDLEGWIKTLDAEFTPPPPSVKKAQNFYRVFMRDFSNPKQSVKVEVKPPPPPVKRDFSPKQLKALDFITGLGGKGLSEFSTDSEIKKVFRALAKIYHPDGANADSVIFQNLYRAYRDIIPH